MMSDWLRCLPRYVLHNLPPFAAALLTAEFFFKFGSFTLECLTFLALWWGLARVYRWVLQLLGLLPWEVAEGSPDG